MNWGGKDITGLPDNILLIAEQDVANALARTHSTPNKPKYNAYFESLSDQAVAIAAEKVKRGLN